MKTFVLTFILSVGILMVSQTDAYGQKVACSDLMTYVKKEGYKKGSVSSMQLLVSSSWLQEVTCYNIEGHLAVVAKIKSNAYDLYGKEYIFCGMSESHWDAFYYGYYDIDTSYGERFHKYIFDYKCDCY